MGSKKAFFSKQTTCWNNLGILAPGTMPSWSDYGEIPGIDKILWGCVLITILGLVEMIASSIVVSYSYGYYIGAIYAGILAILNGVYGFQLRSKYQSQIFLFMCCMGFIVCVVGTALAAGSFNFVSTIQACASTVNSGGTCGTTPYGTYYFDCYGDSSYYAYAASCEVSYDVDNGSESNHCSCVTDADDSDCYNYGNFDDCSHLTGSSLPSQLQTCYAIGVVLIFAYAYLVIVTTLSVYYPETYGDVPETIPVTSTIQSQGDYIPPAEAVLVTATVVGRSVPVTTTAPVRGVVVGVTPSANTPTTTANPLVKRGNVETA